jgi:hypothetical protein
MDSWRISDGAGGEFGTQNAPWIPIGNEQVLQAELEKLKQLEPRVAKLLSPAGNYIIFGIGGSLSFVEVTSGPERLKVIACTDVLPEDADFGFVYDSVPSDIEADYLIPVETAIEIILHYYSQGKLLNSIRWDRR